MCVCVCVCVSMNEFVRVRESFFDKFHVEFPVDFY